MRKLLIPLLLASALAPATASAERADRDRQSESKSSNDNRPQRADRSSQADRPARVERAERPARVERTERPARVERGERVERVQQDERIERPANIERVQRINRDGDGERQIERRARRPDSQAEPVKEVRTAEPVQPVDTRRRSNNDLVEAFRQSIANNDRDRDRDHDRDRDRWRDRDGHRWSGDWRHDRRYDWWNYRNRYSSLFRLGNYYDPYGWGYRRYSTGLSLWPSYYGSSYWLNDPWQYRLPSVYGPYRWVRYYDDALLVNIYTGEVADVVLNFFW
jgi:hypothetical protein